LLFELSSEEVDFFSLGKIKLFDNRRLMIRFYDGVSINDDGKNDPLNYNKLNENTIEFPINSIREIDFGVISQDTKKQFFIYSQVKRSIQQTNKLSSENDSCRNELNLDSTSQGSLHASKNDKDQVDRLKKEINRLKKIINHNKYAGVNSLGSEELNEENEDILDQEIKSEITNNNELNEVQTDEYRDNKSIQLNRENRIKKQNQREINNLNEIISDLKEELEETKNYNESLIIELTIAKKVQEARTKEFIRREEELKKKIEENHENFKKKMKEDDEVINNMTNTINTLSQENSNLIIQLNETNIKFNIINENFTKKRFKKDEKFIRKNSQIDEIKEDTKKLKNYNEINIRDQSESEENSNEIKLPEISSHKKENSLQRVHSKKKIKNIKETNISKSSKSDGKSLSSHNSEIKNFSSKSSNAEKKKYQGSDQELIANTFMMNN
jgi:hypothetical protein